MVDRAHQPGRRVRAALALTTACVFVACGMLAMHHASNVAHVRDAHTGAATHGLETECDGGAPNTHLHSSPSHEHELEACALTDVLHQAAHAADPILVSIAAQLARPVELRSRDAIVLDQLLLTAPKTSPPVRA